MNVISKTLHFTFTFFFN